MKLAMRTIHRYNPVILIRLKPPTMRDSVHGGFFISGDAMDLNQLCNHVRMELYADEVYVQERHGSQIFVARAGNKYFQWHVPLTVYWLPDGDSIKDAVDAFRDKFKMLGC